MTEPESRSSQPSSSSEITEAMNALEIAATKRATARAAFQKGDRWVDDGHASHATESYLLDADEDARAARIRLESLHLEQRREISDLRERLTSWEEDESRVCPEDVGMEEYIPILEKRVREQLQEIERRGRLYDATFADWQETRNEWINAQLELSSLKDSQLTDTARLDWLDTMGTFGVALNRHDGRQKTQDENGRPVILRLWLKDRGGENQSLREAIDALRPEVEK